jgi:hypothetical protein
MKKELTILNLICVLGAVALLAFAVVNAIVSPDFLSIDNLFITAVFLVLALMLAAGPMLYLKSEGKLPIPFKRSAGSTAVLVGASAGSSSGPALLDSKGRAVPPDVRSMVGRFTPTERKEP